MPGLNETVNRNRGVQVYSPTRRIVRPQGRANAGTAQRILNPGEPQQQVSSRRTTTPQITTPLRPLPGWSPAAGSPELGAPQQAPATYLDSLLSRSAETAAATQEQEQQGGFLGTLVNSGPGRFVMGALDVLDRPRRVVISAVQEGADAINGGDASWRDFVNQANDPTFGFGDVVGSTGNIWVDRIIGFSGDVLLDPLTYVGGSALIAGAGGRSRMGAAARAVAAGVDEDIARTLGRRGYSALDNEARALLREGGDRIYDAGYRFKVPFGPSLPIPGTGGIDRAVSGLGGRLREGLARSPVGSALRRIRSTEGLEEATEKIITGRGNMSFIEAAETVNYHTAARLSRGMAIGRLNAAVSRLERKQGFGDLNALVHTAETEGGTVINEFFDEVLRVAADAGLEIPRRENYFPHVFTEGGQAWIRGEDPNAQAFKSTFFANDDIDDITPHLMSRRITPREEPYNVNGHEFVVREGTVKEMNEIFARLVPDAKFKLLDDNFSTVVARYVKSVAEDIGKVGGLKALLNSKSGLLRRMNDGGEAVRDMVDEAETKLANERLATELKEGLKVASETVKSLREARDRGLAGIRGIVGVEMRAVLDEVETLTVQQRNYLNSLLGDEQQLAARLRVPQGGGQSQLESEFDNALDELDRKAVELEGRMEKVRRRAAADLTAIQSARDPAIIRRIVEQQADPNFGRALEEWNTLSRELVRLKNDQITIETLKDQIHQARLAQEIVDRRLGDPSYLNLAAGPAPDTQYVAPRPGEIRRSIDGRQYRERLVRTGTPMDDAIHQDFKARRDAAIQRRLTVRNLDEETQMLAARIEVQEEALIRAEANLANTAHQHADEINTAQKALQYAREKEADVLRKIEDLRGLPANEARIAKLEDRLRGMRSERGALGRAQRHYKQAQEPVVAAKAVADTERSRAIKLKQEFKRKLDTAREQMVNDPTSPLRRDLASIDARERDALRNAQVKYGLKIEWDPVPELTVQSNKSRAFAKDASYSGMGRVKVHSPEDRERLVQLYRILRDPDSTPGGRALARREAREIEQRASGMTARQFDSYMALEDAQANLRRLEAIREPIRLSTLTDEQRAALTRSPRERGGATRAIPKAKEAVEVADVTLTEYADELIQRGAVFPGTVRRVRELKENVQRLLQQYEKSALPSVRQQIEQQSADLDRITGFMARYKVALNVGIEPSDQLAAYLYRQELKAEYDVLEKQLARHKQLRTTGGDEMAALVKHEAQVVKLQDKLDAAEAEIEAITSDALETGAVDQAALKKATAAARRYERQLRNLSAGPTIGTVGDDIDTMVSMLRDRIMEIDNAVADYNGMRHFKNDYIVNLHEKIALTEANIIDAEALLGESRLSQRRLKSAITRAENTGSEVVRYSPTKMDYDITEVEAEIRSRGFRPGQARLREDGTFPGLDDPDLVVDYEDRIALPDKTLRRTRRGYTKGDLVEIPLDVARARVESTNNAIRQMQAHIENQRIRHQVMTGQAEVEIDNLTVLINDAANPPDVARLTEIAANYERLGELTPSQQAKYDLLKQRIAAAESGPISADELAQLRSRRDRLEKANQDFRELLGTARQRPTGIDNGFEFLREVLRQERYDETLKRNVPAYQLTNEDMIAMADLLGGETSEQARGLLTYLADAIDKRRTLTADDALRLIEDMSALWPDAEINQRMGQMLVDSFGTRIVDDVMIDTSAIEEVTLNALIAAARHKRDEEMREFGTLFRDLGFRAAFGDKRKLQSLGYTLSREKLDEGTLRRFVIEAVLANGYDVTNSVEKRIAQLEVRRARINTQLRGLGYNFQAQGMDNPERFFAKLEMSKQDIAWQAEQIDIAFPREMDEIIENRLAGLASDLTHAINANDNDAIATIMEEISGLETGRLPYFDEVMDATAPPAAPVVPQADVPIIRDDAMPTLEDIRNADGFTQAQREAAMNQLSEFMDSLPDEMTPELNEQLRNMTVRVEIMLSKPVKPDEPVSMVDDAVAAAADEGLPPPPSPPEAAPQVRRDFAEDETLSPTQMREQYEKLTSTVQETIRKVGGWSNVPEDQRANLAAMSARARSLAEMMTGAADEEVQAGFKQIARTNPEYVMMMGRLRQMPPRPRVSYDVWSLMEKGTPSVKVVRQALDQSRVASVLNEGARATPSGRMARNSLQSQIATARQPIDNIATVRERLTRIRDEAAVREQQLTGQLQSIERKTGRAAELEEVLASPVPQVEREIADTARRSALQHQSELDALGRERMAVTAMRLKAEQTYNQALQQAGIDLHNVRSNVLAVKEDLERLTDLRAQLSSALDSKVKKGESITPILEDLRNVNKMRAAYGADPQSIADVEMLLASAAEATALLDNAAMGYDAYVRRIRDFQKGAAKAAPVMKQVAADGWRALTIGDVMVGEDGIVIAQTLANAMQRIDSAVRTPETFKAIEKYTAFFKTYATGKPGFHVRNAISGVFMNLVAGVRMRHIMQAPDIFRSFRRNPQKFWENTTPEIRRALAITFGSGAGGQFMEAGIGEATSTSSKLYKRLMNNAYTRFNKRLGEFTEGSIRLAMALDSVDNGLDDLTALDRLTQFHFDYTQVSRLDRTAKKLIPFWTFMSRNFPLQIEQMWLRPRTYLQYQSLVRNFAAEGDPLAPAYWLAQGAWTPDENAAERDAPWYIAPDLPHLRIAEPLQALASGEGGKAGLSDLNPLFMAPIEAFALGQKVYTGQPIEQNYSEPSGPMSALLPLLQILGGTETGGETGQTLVDDRYAHVARSLIPTLDWAERLLDRSGSREGRQDETFYRTLGAPVYQLTDNLRQSTARSRYYDQREEAERRASVARS